MSLLVVGSVALDSVETPFGSRDEALGGSAVYFSHAACLLHPVQVVGVIGSDFPSGILERLGKRGVDLSGIEKAAGESFRWKGKYSYDLQNRDTISIPRYPTAFGTPSMCSWATSIRSCS
jgi:sugar/nucleoside kinase (ribokinase family)